MKRKKKKKCRNVTAVIASYTLVEVPVRTGSAPSWHFD